jgi:hypothetical protein
LGGRRNLDDEGLAGADGTTFPTVLSIESVDLMRLEVRSTSTLRLVRTASEARS